MLEELRIRAASEERGIGVLGRCQNAPVAGRRGPRIVSIRAKTLVFDWNSKRVSTTMPVSAICASIAIFCASLTMSTSSPTDASMNSRTAGLAEPIDDARASGASLAARRGARARARAGPRDGCPSTTSRAASSGSDTERAPRARTRRQTRELRDAPLRRGGSEDALASSSSASSSSSPPRRRRLGRRHLGARRLLPEPFDLELSVRAGDEAVLLAELRSSRRRTLDGDGERIRADRTAGSSRSRSSQRRSAATIDHVGDDSSVTERTKLAAGRTAGASSCRPPHDRLGLVHAPEENEPRRLRHGRVSTGFSFGSRDGEGGARSAAAAIRTRARTATAIHARETAEKRAKAREPEHARETSGSREPLNAARARSPLSIFHPRRVRRLL